MAIPVVKWADRSSPFSIGRAPCMKNKVKRLKDGRFKLVLDEDLRRVLVQAIAASLHFEGEEMEDYLFALLSETLRALQQQDTPKLPESAVLAMLRISGNYLDEPTQLLLLGLVSP